MPVDLRLKFRAEFEPSAILGVRDWVDEPGAPKYDVATCMFAIHYFFVTEQGLKQFMRNVSLNLKMGEMRTNFSISLRFCPVAKF